MLNSHKDVDYSPTLAQMTSCWLYSNVLKCFFPEFLYLEIVVKGGGGGGKQYVFYKATINCGSVQRLQWESSVLRGDS